MITKSPGGYCFVMAGLLSARSFPFRNRKKDGDSLPPPRITVQKAPGARAVRVRVQGSFGLDRGAKTLILVGEGSFFLRSKTRRAPWPGGTIFCNSVWSPAGPNPFKVSLDSSEIFEKFFSRVDSPLPCIRHQHRRPRPRKPGSARVVSTHPAFSVVFSFFF